MSATATNATTTTTSDAIVATATASGSAGSLTSAPAFSFDSKSDAEVNWQKKGFINTNEKETGGNLGLFASTPRYKVTYTNPNQQGEVLRLEIRKWTAYSLSPAVSADGTINTSTSEGDSQYDIHVYLNPNFFQSTNKAALLKLLGENKCLVGKNKDAQSHFVSELLNENPFPELPYTPPGSRIVFNLNYTAPKRLNLILNALGIRLPEFFMHDVWKVLNQDARLQKISCLYKKIEEEAKPDKFESLFDSINKFIMEQSTRSLSNPDDSVLNRWKNSSDLLYTLLEWCLKNDLFSEALRVSEAMPRENQYKVVISKQEILDQLSAKLISESLKKAESLKASGLLVQENAALFAACHSVSNDKALYRNSSVNRAFFESLIALTQDPVPAKTPILDGNGLDVFLKNFTALVKSRAALKQSDVKKQSEAAATTAMATATATAKVATALSEALATSNASNTLDTKGKVEKAHMLALADSKSDAETGQILEAWKEEGDMPKLLRILKGSTTPEDYIVKPAENPPPGVTVYKAATEYKNDVVYTNPNASEKVKSIVLEYTLMKPNENLAKDSFFIKLLLNPPFDTSAAVRKINMEHPLVFGGYWNEYKKFVSPGELIACGPVLTAFYSIKTIIHAFERFGCQLPKNVIQSILAVQEFNEDFQKHAALYKKIANCNPLDPKIFHSLYDEILRLKDTVSEHRYGDLLYNLFLCCTRHNLWEKAKLVVDTIPEDNLFLNWIDKKALEENITHYYAQKAQLASSPEERCQYLFLAACNPSIHPRKLFMNTDLNNRFFNSLITLCAEANVSQTPLQVGAGWEIFIGNLISMVKRSQTIKPELNTAANKPAVVPTEGISVSMARAASSTAGTPMTYQFDAAQAARPAQNAAAAPTAAMAIATPVTVPSTVEAAHAALNPPITATVDAVSAATATATAAKLG